MPHPKTDDAETSVSLNGAHVLLRSLVAEGVETIFGYPGGVILPVYDALVEYPELRHILVRHEQGACHMAEGYARSSGNAGVVLVTSGPGATNIVTGVADAYYDSTPMVVICGNVPSHLLGNDAFQEADIVGITRPCTKHNVIVRDIRDLPSAIKEAFHVATTGRPGPVVVDIPKDVINAVTNYSPEMARIDLPGYQVKETFTPEQLQELMGLLASAERPVILSGGGVVSSGAHQALLELAELLSVPVGSSLMGLGGFPTSHPLFMGFTGMHGQYWANIAIAKADLLLIIGNRLNERQTGKADRFARNAKIVHIDLDPTSLDKNVASCLPIQGDIPRVLTETLALLKTQRSQWEATLVTRSSWFAEIEGFKARRQEKAIDPRSLPWITPDYAIERIFAHLPADSSYVTTEVGQHQMWAAQKFNLDRPRSFLTSGGLGTMGFGFPAAIGVQAAFPQATVVDIAGDGSFQMTLQELATARQANLPVKVCIINNSYLGMIRQWQGKMFGRESEAVMISPDYVKLAEAYDCAGYRVESVAELDQVLAEALARTDKPVLIDIRVADKADVYPWVEAGKSNEEMLTSPKDWKQEGWSGTENEATEDNSLISGSSALAS
jgi:acetolactate synthase I/II/III large subunit